MKKALIAILGVLLVILLALLIIRLLGYDFNKEYFSYDREACISDNDKKIEGCIFWMRVDHLEKTQNWADLFIKDNEYCDSAYRNSLESMFDPRCDLGAFKHIKRQENWDYLISDEKDGAYDFCIDEYCPTQKLFE